MNSIAQDALARARSAASTVTGALPVLVGATLMLALGAALGLRMDALTPLAAALTAIAWLLLCVLIMTGLSRHTHRRFGPANVVTTFRALVAVGIGALAIDAHLSTEALGYVSVVAILTLALDGVDGALARATALESSFGARFDMEVDALLALALAALIWRTGELGAWILALGTLRYAFLLGALKLPALNAPLNPSMRRKAICVIQIAALCAIVTPLVAAPVSVLIGVIAVALLSWSFALDTIWLLRHAPARS